MVETKIKTALIQNITLYHQKFKTLSLEKSISGANKLTNRFIKYDLIMRLVAKHI